MRQCNLLALAALLSATTISAETVKIEPHTSIAAAMVKIRPGDTLLLAPGTFKESIVLKDRVTLRGSSIDSTIIKGDGRSTTIVMNGSSSVENMTITGGQIGIQVQSGTAKISSAIVKENRGSGILAVKAFPTIENVVICKNGGNGIQASMIGGGSLILDRVTVAENRGFGLAFDGTVPLSVTNSLFYRNEIKAFQNDGDQVIASKNGIYPEQKGYQHNNSTEKPEFQNGGVNPYQVVNKTEYPIGAHFEK